MYYTHSFRVPTASDDAKLSHTFEVFDKRGYNLEHAVRTFCLKHSLNMSLNGPCCDIFKHANHQQNMIRIEKGVSLQNNLKSPQNTPHFGITMPTYQRSYDLTFSLLHNYSLPSVLSQSYPHWTIILVGDALTEHQEEIMLQRVNQLNIPPEKIIYRNLDPQYSEKNIFKERNVLHCSKFGIGESSEWCHSGSGAKNFAFDIADTLPEVTHVLWLSDDDMFFSNHLANLARGFQLREDNEIKFAFTKGYSVSWSWVG